MTYRNLLLQRLDDIGRSLASQATALALIGLGSVGRELERIDDYSDLDFFVIVESEYKQHYIDDLTWLEAAHPLAYTFRNSADGYKFLFADGIYGEMAVFDPEELRNAAYAPGRMVWRRAAIPESAAAPAKWPPRRSPPSADHLLGEALTNLYVGLGRFRRGEKVSAFRFIQGYAIDRIVELAALISDEETPGDDPFDGARRFESRHAATAAELPAMMRGYEHSPESAAAILAWLARHFEIDPAIKEAIESLLS
ncbi:MAG: hypothetical protein KA586_00505 [Candidatus Promineofilum sp.]|nr:hypothetical protein [Promineifilum sp.]